MGGTGDQRVAQRGEERVRVEAGERGRGIDPQSLARATVVASAIAPAAALFPSMPSLPALSTTIGASARPASSSAQANANCWLRPPAPCSRPRRTVTSPPESRHSFACCAADRRSDPADSGRHRRSPNRHSCCRSPLHNPTSGACARAASSRSSLESRISTGAREEMRRLGQGQDHRRRPQCWGKALRSDSAREFRGIPPPSTSQEA